MIKGLYISNSFSDWTPFYSFSVGWGVLLWEWNLNSSYSYSTSLKEKNVRRRLEVCTYDTFAWTKKAIYVHVHIHTSLIKENYIYKSFQTLTEKKQLSRRGKKKKSVIHNLMRATYYFQNKIYIYIYSWAHQLNRLINCFYFYFFI